MLCSVVIVSRIPQQEVHFSHHRYSVSVYILLRAGPRRPQSWRTPDSDMLSFSHAVIDL